MPSDQITLLKNFEKDFKITRRIFLNIRTGWFDHGKNGSNLVSAKDITIDQIQGRYRLNLNDNELGIQEFFFDLEWSPFTENGKEIDVLTREIVDRYFSRLKYAAEKLLSIVLKYIPKEKIYIRASGSGLHVIFFLKGLRMMEEWQMITNYLIAKSKLPNTKNADKLVFGLDKDTILSTDRKIGEFGSWNKLKKDLKGEVDYLNYATYLSVDDLFKANHYPFRPYSFQVKYPNRLKYFDMPINLLQDANQYSSEQPNESIGRKQLTNTQLNSATNTTVVKKNIFVSMYDTAYNISHCPAYWSILRKRETEWYERHFLVKFLKYNQNLSKNQIAQLIKDYACWSDYDPKVTNYYLNKHFREGTCETKVKSPPKQATLIKYGLCKNKCKECVYSSSSSSAIGFE